MTQAERIISKFGTQEKLAEAVGVHQSAVSAWKARGYVPVRQHEAVLAAAKKEGIDLAPEDFFSDQSSKAS